MTSPFQRASEAQNADSVQYEPALQADPTNLRYHCPLLSLPVVHSFDKPRRVCKINERDCHSLLTGLHYVLVLARLAPCRTLQLCRP